MRSGSRSRLTAVSFVLLALGGCKPKPGPEATPAGSASASVAASAPAPPPRAPSPRRTGSALARTVKSDALFVADEDHDTLRRLALPLNQQDIEETKLPGPPAQVLVRDGEVWVTVREPGLLLGFAMEGKGLSEIARIKLPADAWGMGLSPDEKTLAVTSAWSHAVTLVDLPKRAVIKTLDVAREPRGVVFAPDGTHAYVTHLVGTALTRIDLDGEGPRASSVALPASPLRAPPGEATPGASLAYAATLSRDGRRLLVPRHALGAYFPVVRWEGWSASDSNTAWFGSATIDVLTLAKDQPLAPRRIQGAVVRNVGEGGYVEPPLRGTTAPSSPPVPFVQPRDVMLRSRTDTVLVVSEGSAALTEHDARSVDPSLGKIHTYAVGTRYTDKGPRVAMAGAAPQGLALSSDEDTAWVFARGTYEVAEVSLHLDKRTPEEVKAAGMRNIVPVYVRLAEDPLGEEASVGRRIFHDATDTVVSGGLACAGCHPEGRDDGFVWREAREASDRDSTVKTPAVFVGHPSALIEAADEGRARQTPMLAGRIDAEGPYGWHGQNKNLEERVAEGFQLHRWSAVAEGKPSLEETARIRALAAFLRKKGLRPPPREERPLTDEETRGKAVFMDARTACASCHPADTGYTNRASVPLRTPLPTRAGFARDEDEAFKVPSLLFVGGTAPYYHDGSARTLEELVEKNGQRMGQTSHLTAEEKKALVAFLRTL